MAKLAFVDTHVHFYDLKSSELRYEWLEPEAVHPILGNIDPIKALRYDADSYLAETRFSNVIKAVHIQAAIGSNDSVKETEWLQQQADRTGFPQGIVAYCDLSKPDVEREIERHLAFANVRGIRDFGEGDYLSSSAWQRGYGMLEKYNLVCDLDCVWENMSKARDVSRRFSEVTMVLEHTGFPRSRDIEYFRAWQAGMREIAKAEGVVCKISGLGMCDHNWSVKSIRPWVMSAIEIFGVARCFFGTNWPVDRLWSSFDPLVCAYEELIGEFTSAEQVALFQGNAERIYRI